MFRSDFLPLCLTQSRCFLPAEQLLSVTADRSAIVKAPNITLHNPVDTPCSTAEERKKVQLSLNAPRTPKDVHVPRCSRRSKPPRRRLSGGKCQSVSESVSLFKESEPGGSSQELFLDLMSQSVTICCRFTPSVSADELVLPPKSVLQVQHVAHNN